MRYNVGDRVRNKKTNDVGTVIKVWEWAESADPNPYRINWDNMPYLDSTWYSDTDLIDDGIENELFNGLEASLDKARCRHRNKRKSFVVKLGKKEEFFYCPQCQQEVD